MTSDQCKITEEIIRLATGRFDQASVDQFVSRFCEFSSGSTAIIDYFLQISTDHDEELELGFFTVSTIVDLTLSRGKIYSCACALTATTDLAITESETKSTLTITGAKKFDYNVVRPGDISGLESYKESLQRHLKGSLNSAASPFSGF